ncbi:hypothetical protein L5515_014596 [Caenorhabditis briggsae]|uniref:Uncharacterized protein n=1 Tax=Caenorhabditis briggsae TaxID=6238 RepID=A0AAE9EGQ2_CAEBR|nr:hypothetical protein L5515_014596 [Caenorhabditis briggsae]
MKRYKTKPLTQLVQLQNREYTERILTTEFTGFIVHVGSISNESLVELTKEFPEKANIIIDLDISSDYSNAKALKFHAVDYKEALIYDEKDGDVEFFIKATHIGHRKFIYGHLKVREKKTIFTT